MFSVEIQIYTIAFLSLLAEVFSHYILRKFRNECRTIRSDEPLSFTVGDSDDNK